MDILGPQSVLDHRRGDNIIKEDRFSRGRLKQVNEESEQELIDLKTPQAYRTSFSSIATPVRLKTRSRSPSPLTSSLKSCRSSSKTSLERRHSPKHVTYDSNVTIRHSDSFDDSLGSSISLSNSNKTMGQPKRVNEDRHQQPLRYNDSENMDYSSKIREMTKKLEEEYPSEHKNGMMDSENRFKPSMENRPANEQRRLQTVPSEGRGKPNGQTLIGRPPRPKQQVLISREYDHDRTVSYRNAISAQYSKEIRELADACVEEDDHDKVSLKSASSSTNNRMSRSSVSDSRMNDNRAPGMARSTSMPLGPNTHHIENENRLTPKKKSLGGSIGNFFKRMSPGMSNSKKKGSSRGSVSSLSSSTRGSEENVSRSKLRRSFMKFAGKSKSKTENPESSVDAPIQSDHRVDNHVIPQSSNKMMQSIEQNSRSDKEVYQKFKDRQTPPRSAESKQQPVRAQRAVSHQSEPTRPTSRSESTGREFDETPSRPVARPRRSEGGSRDDQRFEPPVPRPRRSQDRTSSTNSPQEYSTDKPTRSQRNSRKNEFATPIQSDELNGYRDSDLYPQSRSHDNLSGSHDRPSRSHDSDAYVTHGHQKGIGAVPDIVKDVPDSPHHRREITPTLQREVTYHAVESSNPKEPEKFTDVSSYPDFKDSGQYSSGKIHIFIPTLFKENIRIM